MNKILFRPWKELKILQDRTLHHFITRHLYPFSPHYRKLFDENKINPRRIKTVDDLRAIPFSSKDSFFDAQSEDLAKGTLAFCLQPGEEALKKYLPKTELIKFLCLNTLRGARITCR